MVHRWLLLCLLMTSPIFTTSAAAQTAREPVASEAGADFSLIDHNGKPFQLSDHRGKVILLFFGYTSCTEACPVILSRINSVFKQLGAEQDRALAVFISVDPQRDTTNVLREYVQYFSARTVALTGKKDQIDAVVKQYGAKYEIETSDSALGYHISHTTDIYLVDQRGALRSRFKHTDSPTLIATEVQKLLR